MSASNGMRVLVIDDNTDYGESVQMVFRAFAPHVTVECRETAKEGIARLVQSPPIDCILLDLVLPCGRGPDVLDLVLRGAPEIPIIVISGYIQADPDLDELLIKSGAQDVLPKAGTSAETLVRTILHAIARHRVRIKTTAKEPIEAARQTAQQLSSLTDSQMKKSNMARSGV